MRNLAPLEPIDYLIIGHLTVDLTPAGPRLGGTAAYSSLTARALGLRVGLVTSFSGELPLDVLEDAGVRIINFPDESSTTFENIPTPHGRRQVVHSVASLLNYHMIPETWRSVPIVHLGPVAQEVEPSIVRYFPSSLIGVTPQGWLRAWDEQGHVYPTEWLEATFLLSQVGAVVLSVEDVAYSEERIEEMVTASRVLAVTEADAGARVYWNGDVRRFRPPTVVEVDATGSGDIFAAAFFSRLYTTETLGSPAALQPSYPLTPSPVPVWQVLQPLQKSKKA